MAVPILPPEIIAEILMRFDVKSLLPLKCVCKLWRSIIESRHFIKKHLKRTNAIDTPTVSLKEDRRKDFHILRLKNGLVLEKHQRTNDYRVRNPATKTVFDLPDDPLHKTKFTSFSYLPTSESYKVVQAFSKDGFGGCRVLTLGTDLAWRILDIPNLKCIKDSQLDSRLYLCADEVVYVMWFSDASRTRIARDIVCIDVETEGFETVRAPEGLFSSWEHVWPLDWDGKMSVYKVVGEELHVWVVEDYKNQRWAEKKKVISVSFLSKHANISDIKFLLFSKKGWLYFYAGKFRIWYHIGSGREEVIDTSRDTTWTVKCNLMNPDGSSAAYY